MKLNRKIRKLFAVVLSLALVITSITIAPSTAKADVEAPEGYTLLANGDSKAGLTEAWDLYVGDWREDGGTQYAYVCVKNDETDPYKISLDFTETTTGDWLVQAKVTFSDLTIGTKYEYSLKNGNGEVLDSGIFVADAETKTSNTLNLGWTAQGTQMDIIGTCEEYVTPPVDPDADYVGWISTDRNLAFNKTATVSSYKEGSTDYSVLTDGVCDKWNGNYVGVNTPGYLDVDLGATYEASSIDQVVVWFRNGDANLYPANGFKIQFGDVSFETVATVTEYPSGAMTTQTDGSQYMVPVVLDKESISGSVKKVRIQVDDSVAWGTQVAEIAVFAENPVEGEEAEPAENAAAVTVSSEKTSAMTGEIKVNITAGEGQEDYTYLVYLDNAASASLTGCIAGQDYTISGVAAGTHTVKVVSYYNGGTSEGIVSDEVEVKTILDDVTDASRNFALNKDWELLPLEGSALSHGSAEGNGDITNGIISDSDFVCPIKDTAGAYYIIDLGKEVEASSIDSVYVWYRVMEPGCAPNEANSQDIKYSTDKENWTDVTSVAGADVVAARTEQGSAPYAVTADVSAAEGTVRYIQIYYPLGIAYGAQVTEIAVFGEVGEPEEPTEETTEAEETTEEPTEEPTEETTEEPVVTIPDAASYDWSQVENYLGAGVPGTENQYKAVCVDGVVSEIVNVQQPIADADPGIYITFPDADFGEITVNGEAAQFNDMGAGAARLFYLSNFTNKYSDVVVKKADGSVKAVIYVLNENGIDNSGNTPEVEPIEVTGVTATQVENELKISVNWSESEEATALGQTYNVYVDDTKVLSSVAVGTYEVEAAEGTHTVKVTAVLGDKESEGVTAEVTVAAVDTTDSTEETTEESTEETTDEPVVEITMDQTLDTEGDHDLGGYVIYVGASWSASRAIAGVDANDSNHIKIQQTASDWSQAWTLQVVNKFTGLEPNTEYTVEWPIVATSDDGTIRLTGDVDVKLVAGSQTLTATFTTDGSGNGDFVAGLGWVGLANPIEFFAPVVKDQEGNVVTPEEPTEEPTDEPTEEPTDEPTEAPTNAPADQTPAATTPSATTVAPTTAEPTTVAPTTAAPTIVAPASVTVKKATKKKSAKKVTITLKKVSGAAGYTVKVSTSKKFTKKTTVTKTTKKIKVTVKKLRANKTYYVKARAYKKVNGKKVYGKWSKVKKVTNK